MALTKQDLSQIKDIVHDEVEGAVDELARIVNKGFEQTATKSDIARLELEIHEIKERVTYIERDIAEIRKGLISRVELEDILARLLLVEKKLGIESGK